MTPLSADPALCATPTQLLDAAERLFAQRGIDKVSIREIVRASGQANLSAAHYHFGSREALVVALVQRRMQVINAWRHQALDAVQAAGRGHDVRAIVSATVGVLADVVCRQPWGPDYVCITASATFDPQRLLRELIDPDSISGLVRCNQMLRGLLPGLPAQVFRERMRLVNNETAYSVARWVRAHGPVTPEQRGRFDAMVLNLIDFLAAGLQAPVTGPSAE